MSIWSQAETQRALLCTRVLIDHHHPCWLRRNKTNGSWTKPPTTSPATAATARLSVAGMCIAQLGTNTSDQCFRILQPHHPPLIHHSSTTHPQCSPLLVPFPELVRSFRRRLSRLQYETTLQPSFVKGRGLPHLCPTSFTLGTHEQLAPR